jgi:hypothetical protein
MSDTSDQADAAMRREVEMLVHSAYGAIRILHAAGQPVPLTHLGAQLAAELDRIVTRWTDRQGRIDV